MFGMENLPQLNTAEAQERARQLLALMSSLIPQEQRQGSQSEMASSSRHTGSQIQSEMASSSRHTGSQIQSEMASSSRHTGSQIQSEMTRSFPGFFKTGRKRPSTSVSSRFTSMSKKKWKPFDLSVFLLSSNDELTPLPSDELAFMQAGLGKRTVSLDRDLTHVELSRLLQATYPKMVELQDRWLLYKAGGGNGRRKMSAIPLEAEGYTGAMLRKVTGGGKGTLYIVPLQDVLDLSPLPANAPEFALMPKASCKHCFAEMPLQMLALHDCKCAIHTSSDVETISDDDDDDDDVQLPKVLQTPVPVQMTEEDHCTQQKEDVQCPICGFFFPVLLIEEHASHCGQRTEDTTSPERELHTETDDISCEEDVIMWLKSKVDTSKTFELCVSRDNMLERGLKLWKRNKKGTPINPLRITFLGEAGIDTGALRKEFLTTMVSGIEQRFFEGGKSKMPIYSVNDFDEELFRIAGEIFATSIAQGGPAPRFLHRWCYSFLVSGKLSLDHVLDPSLSPLITAVAEASDMAEFIADIMDCGYTGKIDMEHKENILRAIGLHAMTKRMPMLQQLREGLDIYGFSQVMQAKTEECRSLFVAGDDESVDSYYITSHLAPEMSERGSNKHHKETQILEHFQDFLNELEVAEPDATSEDITTVPSVMQWITGQAHRHLLLSDRQNFKITVKFDHDCHKMPNHTICYPTVSACTDTITFPVAHMTDYGSFKNVMTTAIKYGAGFDRV